MKIIHINTGDSGGGAGNFAFDFVNYYDTGTHLLVRDKLIQSHKVIPIPGNFLDTSIPLFNKIMWKAGVKKSIRQLFSITEEYHFTFKKLLTLKEYIHSDIVHLHNIHGEYFDFSAIEKIANDKPVVWSLHDMWAMTGGEAFTFDNENYKIGNGWTPYDRYYPLCSPLIDRRQHFLDLKKKTYEKIADKITFVPGCCWLSDCLRNSYVWNPGMKINTIHEGIDTSLFNNKNQRTWNIPRILIININNPFKGTGLFKDLFGQFKENFELYVVGDTIRFETTAKKVHQLSYLKDKNDLATLFNNVDILIFPSLAENFALTTLSAMSCGVCVLASSVGGLPEQLANGNGMLFNYNNLNEIIEKLEDLTGNLQQTRAIGLNAEQTVKERFDVKLMHNKYDDLYRELLK